MALPDTFLQMRSTITEDGQLQLALTEKPLPQPAPDQVLIRIEAAPINPSDHGVMFGPADLSQATSTGSGISSVLTAPVPKTALRMLKARIGKPLLVGNEGAGTVVAAGDSDAARALEGKVVAAMGGGMYGQYRCVPVNQCLPLLHGHTARDGASSFVNPLTALGFVETMRREGHTALVHTAAASNLGQMLNRVCQADGIEVVNIVRRSEQVDLLCELGATHICNSSDDSFMSDLIEAIDQVGATLAFDATGGGDLASRILTAMEAAAARSQENFSIYGSTRHKQVYLYGGLDLSPTVLTRGYGMAWGVGGWLMPNFLATVEPEVVGRMRQRVASELKTTFASQYTDEISLAEALQAEVARRHNAKVTGEKFLICPQLDR